MLARFLVEREILAKGRFTDEHYIEGVVLLEQEGMKALLGGKTGFMAGAALAQEGRFEFSKWVQDKVRDLEHLKGICAEQLKYIKELDTRLEDRNREIQHLNAKLNRTVMRRLKGFFR